jgi:hypothetical protein
MVRLVASARRPSATSAPALSRRAEAASPFRRGRSSLLSLPLLPAATTAPDEGGGCHHRFRRGGFSAAQGCHRGRLVAAHQAGASRRRPSTPRASTPLAPASALVSAVAHLQQHPQHVHPVHPAYAALLCPRLLRSIQPRQHPVVAQQLRAPAPANRANHIGVDQTSVPKASRTHARTPKASRTRTHIILCLSPLPPKHTHAFTLSPNL